jgi:glycosyltransferase involved in cell wall biosynthesis
MSFDVLASWREEISPGATGVRKPLRVACIGSRGLPSNYSGLERACEGLYSALAQRGHEITVYCRPECAWYSSHSYRGIRLRHAPAVRSTQLETLSHVATSLVHAFRRDRYDVVHLHALAPSVFSRLCRARGIPTVATVHGLDWQRAKWNGLGSKVLQFAERSMVRNVDRILVVSRDLQGYYASQYGRETIYIPNGVEPVTEAEFKNSTVLRDFGLKSRDYVLYVGRLVPEKRVEDLIVAYRGVRGHCKLVIAGESAFGSTCIDGLRRLAAEDNRVVFVGLQSKPAVHLLLHHAAVLAFPSLMEGLPMSLLECMQHGTPAVVSDIPPHRELLGSVAGYDLFYPPTDVGALQKQIETALTKQGEYRRIAEGGRSVASEMHRWSEIAERTEAVLYSALDRSTTGAKLNGRKVNNLRLRSEAAGGRSLVNLQNKVDQ